MLDRSKWWDVNMTDSELESVLSCELFKQIKQGGFSSNRSFEEIVCEHTRIRHFRASELILRAGDYGNSAYLILSGTVDVIFPNQSTEEIFGRPTPQRTNWFKELSKLWKNPVYPEVRSNIKDALSNFDIKTGDGDRHQVFVRNYEKIANEIGESIVMRSTGDIFGETAALSRSPRTAHVVAATDCVLVEIRWQGLHTFRKFNDQFRQKIDVLYRKNSLDYLRLIPIFSMLDKQEQDYVIENSLFETYGDFAWQDDYKKAVEQDTSDLLKSEVLIVSEGDYADGLLFIRSGIARVSNQFNHGHRVIKYLNTGDVFGLDVIINNWKNKQTNPLLTSLHAVGYTDILRVPSLIIEEYVLPKMSSEEVEKEIASFKSQVKQSATEANDLRQSDGILEFLSDYRYINGSSTMLIDLDRCVRCDDCVNACSVGHYNNPKFIRHGRQYDHYMIANACMHCHDPVCMIGCPTGAIHREQKGQIVITDEICIGCSTCANSCPYDNIQMIAARDTDGGFLKDEITEKQVLKASKCDLCYDQLTGPACVNACPHDALKRIDILSLSSLIDDVNQ